MPRDVVQTRTARDAIEIQSESSSLRGFSAHLFEGGLQILARALRVAQHQTNRVAHLRIVRDGYDTMLLAGAYDVAHDEAPALQALRVVVERDPHKYECKR